MTVLVENRTPAGGGEDGRKEARGFDWRVFCERLSAFIVRAI
ncbi:hypothetical protein [Streptomyces sp. NPDC003273]